jgi:hypothetical protein
VHTRGMSFTKAKPNVTSRAVGGRASTRLSRFANTHENSRRIVPGLHGHRNDGSSTYREVGSGADSRHAFTQGLQQSHRGARAPASTRPRQHLGEPCGDSETQANPWERNYVRDNARKVLVKRVLIQNA